MLEKKNTLRLLWIGITVLLITTFTFSMLWVSSRNELTQNEKQISRISNDSSNELSQKQEELNKAILKQEYLLSFVTEGVDVRFSFGYRPSYLYSSVDLKETVSISSDQWSTGRMITRKPGTKTIYGLMNEEGEIVWTDKESYFFIKETETEKSSSN